MSRGRKPNQTIKNDWESIFLNSVGNYVQLINTLLSKEIQPEPLSNYIRIAGGYAFKSSNYSIKGIPVIRISDFNNERIILDSVKYYKEDAVLKKYELHQGDIIIALTGGTIAKLGIVQKGIGKLYLNQRVGKFEVLNPKIFENEYVYWIARSVQSIIKNLAWGAAIPNVSPKQIEKLEFPIPVKKTQKAIINFLNDLKNNKIKSDVVYFNSEIEKQIVLMHQNQVDGTNLSTALFHQLNLVKKLRQSFLREAMQGKLTSEWRASHPELVSGSHSATELLAKIKAEKKQLIKEGKIRGPKPLPPISEDEVPFDIPSNWTWCRLGEVVEMGRGRFSIRPRNDPRYFNGSYPFLQIGSLNEYGSRIYNAPQTLNEKGLTVSKMFPKNTIVIAIVGGTIGNLGVLGVEMCFTDSMIGFFPYPSMYNQEYLLNFLRFKQPEIKYASYQMAGQPNIKIPTLSELYFPLPPLSEQIRIVAKLDELMAYCDSLEVSIKKSQTENEMLLQQVLREALEPKTESIKEEVIL